jgi:RHS repeat-associated protein
VSQITYDAAEGGRSFAECYSYHAAGAVTQKTLLMPNISGGSVAATYSYDNEGRVSSLVYPGSSPITLTYVLDSMGRPYSVTGGATTVSSATYGPSNEMLTLATGAFSETRTYNANVQLVTLASGGYSFQYNYSSTQNNGRIQSMTDSISGETITYQYDSLNRLINASGTGDANGAWSQAFTYDGFGNLVAKAGTNAPNNITINVNPANNQLTGNNALFDSVGNLLQYGTGTPEQTYAYDIENRVWQLTANSVTTQYGYDSRNQRVYSGPTTIGNCSGTGEKVFFYGIDGKKLEVFTISWTKQGLQCSETWSATQTNIWFAGRLLQGQDRLNSIGKYFPYGEDRTNPSPANPPNGQEKFATYTRDAESGLDYAYQRYYTSGIGRFLTPDKNSGSASSGEPQAYNRYTRVSGDPTNRRDEIGTCDPSDPSCNPFWCTGDPEDCPPPPCDAGGHPVSEFEPVNAPPCQPVSQPPPTGGGPSVSCDITVQYAFAPQDGQDVSVSATGNPYGPLSNTLGPYSTVGRSGLPFKDQGYYFAVQVTAVLFGDTNPLDWEPTQTVQLSVVGTGRGTNGSSIPLTGAGDWAYDGPTDGNINYSTTGKLDYLDVVGYPLYLTNDQGGVYGTVNNATFTFDFTTSLTDPSAHKACFANWTLQLTVTTQLTRKLWNFVHF